MGPIAREGVTIDQTSHRVVGLGQGSECSHPDGGSPEGGPFRVEMLNGQNPGSNGGGHVQQSAGLASPNRSPTGDWDPKSTRHRQSPWSAITCPQWISKSSTTAIRGDALQRKLNWVSEWQDKDGLQYELNYLVDTGELYVMSEPPSHENVDPFGGIHVSNRPGFEKDLHVRVVAHIDSVDNMHQILKGWQDAMGADGGVEWLADRLRASGVAVTPAAGS